jgi:outer membrane immunogenic protein
MQKLSLGIAVAAALGFIAGPATAADILKAPPPPVMPALYNWSGVYIGVPELAPLGICVLSNQANTFPTTCSDVGHPLHGGFVGGEAGFNWQFDRWVFGIEGDGNWAEIEEALTCAVPLVDLSCGSKIRDFETVRARIGYAFGPRGDFLAYLTGGWATARVGLFEAALLLPLNTVTDWQRHNGFVVGGGAEYGITPWLSVKGEILYVWLEGKDHCFGNCTVIPLVEALVGMPAHVREDFIAARMGLNWRFWWGKGTPVVASY